MLLPLAAVTGLLLIGAIIFALYLLARVRSFRLVIPISTAILAILFVVFRPIEKIVESLKSPIVFFGYCEHTVTGLSVKLRADNSFEYNMGAFLRSDVRHGKYTLEDDTIRLTFEDSLPYSIKTTLILKEDYIIEIGDTASHRHSFLSLLNKLSSKKEPKSN